MSISAILVNSDGQPPALPASNDPIILRIPPRFGVSIEVVPFVVDEEVIVEVAGELEVVVLREQAANVNAAIAAPLPIKNSRLETPLVLPVLILSIFPSLRNL